jgi:hypothetical protein
MKFADFHAGQVIEAGPYVLTEAELLSSPGPTTRSGSTPTPKPRRTAPSAA